MDALRARLTDQAYEEAIRHCTTSILPMHLGERLVNKIFGRNLQSHAAGLLAVMHCEAELGLAARPTLTQIQEEMGASRTLSAFFALLKVAGFVETIPNADDRRAKLLAAKTPLIDGLTTWLSHHMTCAEVAGLLPDGNARRLRADEDFAVAFIASARPILERTRSALKQPGAWAWFDEFDCGDRMALALLRAHYSSNDLDGDRWFALESRYLASQLGISHSHLRNVINAAEAEGLVLQNRHSHRVALTPRMLSDVRSFHLAFWGWIAEAADQALRHRSHRA
ncbi:MULTISPECIES: hypothetical protein [Rhizobium]|uniref:MarR family transcriptional regulator n=1 Tax=Rhizobium wuzhouense TaxID=1986026 RepID=A0ABX5NK16_9HYPH|nr:MULTISPECIES: hypothetical protein [Rhizobium]PYB69797.1 hypothetical protein DMY87_23235 [Rhizobium wuzhouense]RKE79196.1 hypothetical protein DFO46_3926 [Rhizobium sp. AG855]